MNKSILSTIKLMLGLTPDYRAFDPEIIVFINTALVAIRQIGIGPQNGFSVITGLETWTDLLGENEPILESVKTMLYVKVRMMFDPPSNGTIVEALNTMLDEAQWRAYIEVNPASTFNED